MKENWKTLQLNQKWKKRINILCKLRLEHVKKWNEKYVYSYRRKYYVLFIPNFFYISNQHETNMKGEKVIEVFI
jgi:hypothetical protein